MNSFKKINFEEGKMKKRILGTMFTAALGLLLGVAVAGCGEKVDRASLPGGFYTLQEAYEG